MTTIDEAVELAWVYTAQVTSTRGSFAALFPRHSLCVFGPLDCGGYRVRWTIDGHESFETLADPVRAVERAIELEWELLRPAWRRRSVDAVNAFSEQLVSLAPSASCHSPFWVKAVDTAVSHVHKACVRLAWKLEEGLA